MTRAIAVVGIVALWLLLQAAAASAQAQQQCGPRAAVIKTLAEKYAETRRAIGINGSTLVMEVWAGAAGTWTITVTRPDGITCLVASGQGFETVTEALPLPGVPG